MRKCQISLAMKEMHFIFFFEMYFKTTKRYCYTSIRMAKMKVRIPSIGKNTEQPELSQTTAYTNWFQSSQKTIQQYLLKLNVCIACDPLSSLLSIYKYIYILNINTSICSSKYMYQNFQNFQNFHKPHYFQEPKPESYYLNIH